MILHNHQTKLEHQNLIFRQHHIDRYNKKVGLSISCIQRFYTHLKKKTFWRNYIFFHYFVEFSCVSKSVLNSPQPDLNNYFLFPTAICSLYKGDCELCTSYRSHKYSHSCSPWFPYGKFPGHQLNAVHSVEK